MKTMKKFYMIGMIIIAAAVSFAGCKRKERDKEKDFKDLLSSVEVTAEITVLKDTEIDCTGAQDSQLIRGWYDNGMGDMENYRSEGRDGILQKLAEFYPVEMPESFMPGGYVPDEYIALYAYGAEGNGILQWGNRFVELNRSFVENQTFRAPSVELIDIDGDNKKEVCVIASDRDSSNLFVCKKEGDDIVRYDYWYRFSLWDCVGFERNEDGCAIYAGDFVCKRVFDYPEKYSDEFGIGDVGCLFLGGRVYMTAALAVGYEGRSIMNAREYLGFVNGEIRLHDGVFTIGGFYLQELSQEHYGFESVESEN